MISKPKTVRELRKESLKVGYDTSYTIARNTLVEMWMACEPNTPNEKKVYEMLVEFKKLHNTVSNDTHIGTDATIGKINKNFKTLAVSAMEQVMLESYLERSLQLIQHLREDFEL